MKHLAAYLLLSLNGGSPSESDVKKLLSSVGIEADASRLEKLFAELKGKDINEVTPLTHLAFPPRVLSQMLTC